MTTDKKRAILEAAAKACGIELLPHDGTPEGKEASWRLAATIVAAKIGGYGE